MPTRVRLPACPEGTFQLCVVLAGIAPPVWRRIWVPADTSLLRLDQILRIGMGWTQQQRHEFQISGSRYGRRGTSAAGDRTLIDERRLTIGALLQADTTSFSYLYGNGVPWRHILTVESFMPPSALNHWPQCLAGANACPPDDIGGPAGHSNFLLAMGSQAHPQHPALRRWYGGPYDPSGFDPNTTNRQLRRLG